MESQPPASGDRPEPRRRSRVRLAGVERLDRPRRVVLRDLIIFEIKLFLDGAKGVAVSVLALGAAGLDLLRPGDSPGHRFYAVMRLGERLDRWLSLYGAAEAAEGDPEGLFGVSRAGSPTLLGRLEALVHHAVVGEDDGGIEESAGQAAAAAAETAETAEEPGLPPQEGADAAEQRLVDGGAVEAEPPAP